MKLRRMVHLVLGGIITIGLLTSTGVTAFAAAACATPLTPNATAQSVVSKSYADWKAAYVVDAGNGMFRVQRSAGDNYDTVSEGIAYGMLFSVYSNDKSTFDGLWKYARSHVNQNGVMNWRIGADGSTTGYNGATDADEDMAAALVAADKQWNGYSADALSQIGLIKRYEVENGSNVLKPGDVWGGSDLINPSYLSPSYYSVFAQYSGDASWNDVKTASLRTLNAIATNSPNLTTGFIPDWSTASGQRTGGMSYDYGYDGSRLPVRLAMSSQWDCDATSTSMLQRLNATHQVTGLNGLGSSYSLSGMQLGHGDGTPILAAATTAATTSTNDSYRSAAWSALVSRTSGDYFSDSMRLFGLYVAGGIMVSPLSLTSKTPAAPNGPVSAPKTYSLGSNDAKIVVGTNATILVGALAPSPLQNALVDLEIYDKDGNKVAQKFYENQSLSTSVSSFTIDFNPSATGTYVVKGGIFTSGWSSNLLWNGSIASLSVSAKPVIVPPVITPTPTPVPTPTPTPVPVVPVPVVTQPTAANLSIWWPSNGQAVSGVQPFKAVVDGTDLSSYEMYWQVDGGGLVHMDSVFDAAPHKEMLVDLSGWNWRDSQVYTITFVAKKSDGTVVAQKSSVITVRH